MTPVPRGAVAGERPEGPGRNGAPVGFVELPGDVEAAGGGDELPGGAMTAPEGGEASGGGAALAGGGAEISGGGVVWLGGIEVAGGVEVPAGGCDAVAGGVVAPTGGGTDPPAELGVPVAAPAGGAVPDGGSAGADPWPNDQLHATVARASGGCRGPTCDPTCVVVDPARRVSLVDPAMRAGCHSYAVATRRPSARGTPLSKY